ncbi:serpin family protein [Nocardiopsis algeriensis]|uniref:serpin family protein n=1 Tax=Nocardiopsis algeriensis TaxID=1478215 RepID=UPI003B43BC4E
MPPRTAPRTDHLEFAAAVDRRLARHGASHVWSPHSVGTVLALLAAGASGRTLDELRSLLGTGPEELLPALDAAVEPEEGLDLAAFNGLYVPADLPLLPRFAERVGARPGAEVAGADFAGDAEGVRRRVNGKVSDTTRGLIGELLPRGVPGKDTRLLLVNALWAKVAWTDPFDPAYTRDRAFHAPGGRRKVPTMVRTGRCPFARAHGWGMVTLEGHHGLSLDVLLPDEPGAAPLTGGELAALHRGRSVQEVALSLPRFSVETDTSLVEPLASLGVRRMATDEAEFDGIGPEPLKVDEILHRSVLKVDERGAEGAAATAAMMLTAAAVPRRPVAFTVDRPFVFALRRRGALLFLGRVTDPVDPGPSRP